MSYGLKGHECKLHLLDSTLAAGETLNWRSE